MRDEVCLGAVGACGQPCLSTGGECSGWALSPAGTRDPTRSPQRARVCSAQRAQALARKRRARAAGEARRRLFGALVRGLERQGSRIRRALGPARGRPSSIVAHDDGLETVGTDRPRGGAGNELSAALRKTEGVAIHERQPNSASHDKHTDPWTPYTFDLGALRNSPRGCAALSQTPAFPVRTESLSPTQPLAVSCSSDSTWQKKPLRLRPHGVLFRRFDVPQRRLTRRSPSQDRYHHAAGDDEDTPVRKYAAERRSRAQTLRCSSPHRCPDRRRSGMRRRLTRERAPLPQRPMAGPGDRVELPESSPRARRRGTSRYRAPT